MFTIIEKSVSNCFQVSGELFKFGIIYEKKGIVRC